MRLPPVSQRPVTLFPSTSRVRSQWMEVCSDNCRQSRPLRSARRRHPAAASLPQSTLAWRCPPGACRETSGRRSEEHTSQLQSLMRISYAVFCLIKQHTTSFYSIITEKNTQLPTRVQGQLHY